MDFTHIALVNDSTHHKFEITVDGKLAFIDYMKNGNTYFLIHTEVPKEMQGQGIAAALVEKTFRYLEENGLKMRPFCKYVQFYLRQHPAWERLVG